MSIRHVFTTRALGLALLSGGAALAGCAGASEDSPAQDQDGRIGKTSSALRSVTFEEGGGGGGEPTKAPTVAALAKPAACSTMSAGDVRWGSHMATKVAEYILSYTMGGWAPPEAGGTPINLGAAPWHQWFWPGTSSDTQRAEMDDIVTKLIYSIYNGGCSWTGHNQTTMIACGTGGSTFYVSRVELDCTNEYDWWGSGGFGPRYDAAAGTIEPGGLMERFAYLLNRWYPAAGQFFTFSSHRWYKDGRYHYGYQVDPQVARLLANNSTGGTTWTNGNLNPDATQANPEGTNVWPENVVKLENSNGSWWDKRWGFDATNKPCITGNAVRGYASTGTIVKTYTHDANWIWVKCW